MLEPLHVPMWDTHHDQNTREREEGRAGHIQGRSFQPEGENDEEMGRCPRSTVTPGPKVAAKEAFGRHCHPQAPAHLSEGGAELRMGLAVPPIHQPSLDSGRN